MAAHRIKTVLIEDSGLMRIVLSDLLRKDPSIEVVATAKNGFDGVEKVRSLKPQVVITDMVMPQYDGLYVVQQLMKQMPVPIILLSSLDKADPKIFDAIKEGAFDFIDKPHENDLAEGYPMLIRMIREASLSDYLKFRHPTRGRNLFEHTFGPRANYDVVVIGASTGGPSAVEQIVNNLPANLTLPVIIAQHMPDRFIKSFAGRLAGNTGLSISVAQDGEPLLNNHIYLAPGDANIRVVNSGSLPQIQFTSEQFREFNYPSIDCLFDSVAQVYGSRVIAVVLTGMGKDGCCGLDKIRQTGGLTIAQDATSSVVYGMPKVAFESGAASHQIPLTEIPGFIISAL
jgi:two-component system, chemotaxis family, protein-glutamate methylesterase/glutaminase